MTIRRLAILSSAVLGITGTGFALQAGGSGSVALATPPAGITRTEISRANVAGAAGTVDFQEGKETQILELVVEPGGTSGWHTHPQHGMFMVDKGTLTSYGADGPPCDPVEFQTGQAVFFGPHAHPHMVRNQGTEPVELTVLYFNLAPGQAGRLEAERPKECPAELN